jgi:hypothetical protein
MFLRSNNRKKDGKDHRYFSIVENHRLASGKTVQRTVVYLGEINDEQQDCAKREQRNRGPDGPLAGPFVVETFQ